MPLYVWARMWSRIIVSRQRKKAPVVLVKLVGLENEEQQNNEKDHRWWTGSKSAVRLMNDKWRRQCVMNGSRMSEWEGLESLFILSNELTGREISFISVKQSWPGFIFRVSFLFFISNRRNHRTFTRGLSNVTEIRRHFLLNCGFRGLARTGSETKLTLKSFTLTIDSE